MAIDALQIDRDALRESFRRWRDTQEPLATELQESLTALAAYQSHLDAWQRQLGHDREKLQEAEKNIQEQAAADRAELEQAHSAAQAEMAVELKAARDKIATLENELLTRTDELRALECHRTEAMTELELARTRENDLQAKLDEMKHVREQERAQWAEELRHLHELLERRLEPPASPADAPAASGTRPQATAARTPTPATMAGPNADSPVLGSIVEQFDKLRQQRAQGRPELLKPRT